MKNFRFSHSNAHGTKIDHARKIGNGQPRVMIYINFVVLQTLMLHAKFQGNWPSGFEHFLAWRPSWSCDLDHLYKLSFPLPKEAPHKIWL